MTRRRSTVTLPGSSAGTTRSIEVVRWRGREAGPKAYIQAAVHADEVPALLVADHLRRQLDALDAAGHIHGEIVLVPYANPIGLDQFVDGVHLGRFDLDSGRNFNRGFPRLIDVLARRLDGRLGADPEANVRAIRRALRGALAEVAPATEHRALAWALFGMAADADVVLDLHCDFEALMHLYVLAAHRSDGAALAAALDARVVLLADDSGGDSFDEACARLYTQLAERFPQHPIPAACFAVTVELRGERDVDDALAARDTAGLLAFLAQRGCITAVGAAMAAMAAPRHRKKTLITRLEAVDVVEAPVAGVLVWRADLGSKVEQDKLIGEIVTPGGTRREPLRARTAGVLFARRGHRVVRPGQMVAKIAGESPLPWRKPGALLFD
jgi:hypothetical protein